MTDLDTDLDPELDHAWSDRANQLSIDRVRRRQLAENHVPNQVLADYVQETAFKLNLGRTHIQALGHLAHNDQVWRYQTRANTAPPLRGLERRGLVTHSDYTGEPPPFGDDTTVWELTTAGKLVVMLLVEAGILNPGLYGSQLPPPPPGWQDPRPEVTV